MSLLGGALLALVAGCGGKGGDTQEQVDLQGPTLQYDVPAGTWYEGDILDVLVTADDPDGVAGVVVYHRAVGAEYWDATDLTEGELGWTGSIDDLVVPGEDYYFKATDLGNPSAVSYLPEEGAGAPFSVEVSPVSLDLPYTEDFEPAEGETSLHAMGWWAPTEGFNGYPFALSTNQAHGGSTSAYQSRGIDGLDELSDWLISPALDFTTLDEVMVTWYELGQSVGNTEQHGLYVSTTSRSPEDGGFVPVEEALPAAPSGEWGRSAAYDLSQWAGQPIVYLAWYYRGSYADDWYIDDIEVRQLAPDFDASLSWSPDPVLPGETATLVVALDNLSAAGATDLVATLSLPEGGGTLTDDVADVGDVAGNASGGAIFELTLDGDLHNDRYLPLLLDLTDGTDDWTFDLQLTVGRPSTAEVDLTVDEAATGEVVLGLGDPDAPDLEITAYAGALSAGANTVTVDLTPWYDSLPPAPGAMRWFARVQADSAGSVDAFTITCGGVEYSATVVGALAADLPTDVWLPEPPAPTLVSVSPPDVAPGDTAVPLTVILRNDGANTSGPVSAMLSSTDPDVTVDSGGSFVLDPDTWSSGESHTVNGPTISVSSSHVDSMPVSLTLLLDDGVESWSVDVAVEVPWPVLKVVGITIDDSGGDGLLDADETADLEIELVNTGDLGSFGVVWGTLSIADTSTVPAATSSDRVYFGSMSVGSTRHATFDIVVDGGSAGDTIDLVLDLDDGTEQYQATAQLVLGEAPWILLSPSDDATGDTLDDYGFDFVNAKYRVVDGTVELLVDSAVEIDPSTLFIEAWGRSSSLTYLYYRWVLQSGVGTMQGYTSTGGFSNIGTLNADFPSDTQVLLSWDTSVMALNTDSFTVGLASGWCGPDEYYCDHFPDGWGYPYVSFDYSDWYEISW